MNRYVNVEYIVLSQQYNILSFIYNSEYNTWFTSETWSTLVTFDSRFNMIYI